VSGFDCTGLIHVLLLQAFVCVAVHDSIVTVARFAPTSTQRFARCAPDTADASGGSDTPPPVVVSAAYNGELKFVELLSEKTK
jgi:hypothetical protein